MQSSVPLAPDQPRPLEHAHVLRDRRGGHAERRGQLAHVRRSLGQPLEHAPPRRVGEGPEHSVQRVGTTINHPVNYRTGRAAAQGQPQAGGPGAQVAHCRP